MSRLYSALAGLVLLLALSVAAPTEADAHPRSGGPFGLGVILFEPTGLTGKYFIDDMMAIDFHIGVEGVDNNRADNVGFYADFLFHFPVGEFSWATLPLYVGPGLALIIIDDDRYCSRFRCYDNDDDLALALRVPFGVAFWFSKFSGEAFVELTTTLLIIPDTDFDLDAATGFRYYF